MKVTKAIEQLSKFSKEMDVLVFDGDNWQPAKGKVVCPAFKVKRPDDEKGYFEIVRDRKALAKLPEGSKITEVVLLG